MEILTHRKIYQLVGDQTSGSDECITKSQAVAIAQAYRKNITSNLSSYLDNEYIDIFAVEDKPDLSKLKFASNTFNPPATAATLTTTATSLDIDGFVIDYTATADVDWITDIVIDGATITFKVADNTGQQRVGHIVGVNSASKSDAITITQEAYYAPYKHIYKLIAKNATSAPYMTINGQVVTPELDGSDYIYEYTLRTASESDALEQVPFTIAGGGTTTWTEDPSISVSPTSWDLRDGLTKQFTVSYSDTLYEKAWDIASGTIPKDGSTTTTLTTSSQRQSPTVVYTVTDTAPDGSSFTYDKSGMDLSATASSTSAAPSSIKVAYNGAETYIDVTYTPDVYSLKWADGTTSKTTTVGTNAGTITETVVTKLNDEEYTGASISATANVDWITITTSGNNVVMSYTQNSESADRVGIVTVVDDRGNSVTCTITQSFNSWSHTYTLVATGAGSQPTMTINGTVITPSASGSTYTATCTISGTGTDTAPSYVDWSISGGVPSTAWGGYSISVNPNTWNLSSSLSKTFSVSLIQSGTRYEWELTSGTIACDNTSSTSINSYSTSRSGSNYSVSCPGSMTSTQNGMDFTAAATSTSNTGSITVTCTESDATGEFCSVKVYYEQSDYLVWYSSIDPSSVSFTYSGGSKTVTMKTWQQWAIAGTTYGSVNTYTETITCSELKSESSRSWTESFTHDGQTQSVSCTQSGNYKIYTGTISPSSMTFTWQGGSQNATMKTWWWWAGTDTTHHDEKTYTCTVTVAQNVNGGSGTESFIHDGVTKSVSWTQSARDSETWPDWTSSMYYFYWSNGSTTATSISGSYAYNSTTDSAYNAWYVVSGRKRTSSYGNTQNDATVSYTGSKGTPSGSNTSTSSRSDSGTLTQSGSGKTITWSWTQAGKPESAVLGPFYRWKSGNHFDFETIGGTKSLNYEEYYTKDGVEQNVTTKTFALTKETLYSDTKATGSGTVSGTGLSYTWEQAANSRIPTGTIIITDGSTMSAAGGTVKYMAVWRWYWSIGNQTAYLVGDTGEKTYTYAKNTSTSAKSHTLSESYSSSYAVYDDYGLTYPNATTTLTQPGATSTDIKVSVSVKYVYGATTDAGIQATATLSQSVPFNVSVSGEYYYYNNQSTLQTNTFFCSISSGKTSATDTYEPLDIQVNKSIVINSVQVFPTSKTVNGVTYTLST